MIHLSLAEWVVGLIVEPPSLADQVAQRYAAFASRIDRAPDLLVQVTWEPGGDATQSLLQSAVVAKGEEYLLDAPDFYGIIEPFRGQAVLRMRSGAPARETEYFLRVVVALFAWARGGLLIHSAAVLVDEAAFLFMGQSGSGKSTVVSLSQSRDHAVPLGDDLVLLRPVGHEWNAHGTPFWNLQASERAGQTGRGRVRAVYKLVQDREVYAEPMSRAAAAAELLANCPIVNSQPALLPDLLLRCRNIAEVVAVQRLHFRKDDTFWDIITC